MKRGDLKFECNKREHWDGLSGWGSEWTCFQRLRDSFTDTEAAGVRQWCWCYCFWIQRSNGSLRKNPMLCVCEMMTTASLFFRSFSLAVEPVVGFAVRLRLASVRKWMEWSSDVPPLLKVSGYTKSASSTPFILRLHIFSPSFLLLYFRRAWNRCVAILPSCSWSEFWRRLGKNDCHHHQALGDSLSESWTKEETRRSDADIRTRHQIETIIFSTHLRPFFAPVFADRRTTVICIPLFRLSSSTLLFELRLCCEPKYGSQDQ